MNHQVRAGFDETEIARRQRLATAVAAAIGGFLVSTVGHAQLEEVVVTAERRATSLQQTPISIAAFTAETIEAKGIETMEDIGTFTPNLDIKGSRGTGNVSPTYQIRGLSGGGGATGERAAALYVDGVFVPRTTGPFMNMLDVQRVEVLRGPQGTLFGRNSTGGAIRIFTQQPGPDPAGYVKLGLGNFDRQEVSAMANIPLSDTVFFRVQGGFFEQDGYVERGSQMLGSSEDTIGRLQLAFEPNDELAVRLSYSTSEAESDGNPQDLYWFDMRPNLDFEGNRADWISDFLEAAGQPRIEAYNDPRIVLDDYTMPSWCFLDDTDPDWDAACEQINKSEYDQFDVNVEWQLSDTVTLTSITGLTDFSSSGITDWVQLGTEMRPSDVESDVTYQELQLNFALADGRVDLVTGLSYFQEESSSAGANMDRRGTSAYPPQLALGNGDAGVFRTGDNSLTQDATSYGLFANMTWNITDRFAITPGVRFAQDEKEVTQTEFASDDFAPAPGTTSTTVFAEDDWSETDYRLTADFDVTDSVMLYATRSKAFRAGAYSYSIADDLTGEAQTAALALSSPFIPPESVENSELGIRTELLDGRLRLNLTYYDMTYGDRQAPVQVEDLNSPTGFRIELTSAGDVELDGIELDGQIAATDTFFIDFAAGLVDPNLLDVCANNGDFLFPGPVEESYSLGLRWAKAMRNGADLSWSVNYAHVGSQQTHPGGTNNALEKCGSPVPGWFLDSRYELPSYGLTNARVRYASADDRWAVTAFANNLTDETYANFATRFGGGFWDFVNPLVAGGIGIPERSALGRTMGRPREVGVSFQYNFGSAAGD
ncbi:MAG: TonB-dependent receptor [Gammaproteobacteria bacterium]|nr:TonB-dependent receptor [Gammaproteobacteria bacterium]